MTKSGPVFWVERTASKRAEALSNFLTLVDQPFEEAGIDFERGIFGNLFENLDRRRISFRFIAESPA